MYIDKKTFHKLILILIIAMMTVVAGCSEAGEVGSSEQDTNGQPDAALEAAEDDEDTSTDEIEGVGIIRFDDPVYEAKDPASVNADESGQIMVLMYHHIREPEAEWSRTPDNFRSDLEVLYQEGYRPIRLIDYVRGYINVPAGTTPVVLTFDDGNDNNFNMIEDAGGEWVIDPDSAVGVLIHFHEKHPDFRPHATFFINGGTPFGQPEFLSYKLNFLVNNGMDIGNHTETHLHLGDADRFRIQQELARIQMLVSHHVPNYAVNTFALPFGSRPRDEAAALHVIKGEFEGVAYNNEAVLEVGWDPYHSPFHKDFNPHKIRRVRASETKVDNVGMYDWLASFESGSRRRYISDGDPQTIAIPADRADALGENVNALKILVYEPTTETD